jgi:hypothetical protein
LFYRRLFLSLTLAACGFSPVLGQAGPTREFRLEHGRIRLDAPASWHVLAVEDSGRAPQIIFHIRNPAVDSTKARCNVLVDLSRWVGHENTRALVDTLFGALYNGYAVLGDTMPDKNRRFLFWAGRDGDVPYALYDDFARRGAYLVHVRIAWPLKPESSDSWNEALSRDTRALLASLTLDGTRLFPGWAAHPSVSVWGPGRP